MKLGGIEQWVAIRGVHAGAPPLILLHGGPGMSETAFFRACNAPLEQSFQVVYWDQRGAGKSFDPAIPRESMTVERFLADLDELVDVARTQLGQAKVAIFGHSWGSALGVLYAARFPDKVAAYVGSGQVGSWQAAASASYAFALAEAKRRGKHRIAAKLGALGPPPFSLDAFWTERMCLSQLEGRFEPRALWRLGRMLLEESSIFELPRAMHAFRWTLDAMWDEVSRIDLRALAPVLDVPAFFFLGRNDHWVPPETSVAYIDALAAPSKQIVWFEHSGHEPFVDEAERFNAAMVELVRPVAADLPARHDAVA